MPTKLFLNTQIPACLWFLRRNKQQRKGEMLFIDARNHGFLLNRKNRDLSADDINEIAFTYNNWRTGNKEYKDKQGFCKSGTIEEVKALNYALTPGRYVGLQDDEDDFNFEERFNKLREELGNQMLEEDELNKRIKTSLSKILINEEANG